MNAEQGETGDPGRDVPMVEIPVVEVSRGQRFAGWWLQIFAVVLLFFSVLLTPFWLGGLIGLISRGEYDGILIRDAAYFAGGMVGAAIGALMRACGVMMRGSVRCPDGRHFVWWALCSVGKIVGVVLAVGMGFGALSAGNAENYLVIVCCLVLLGVFVSATVRLHSMRSRFVMR